MGSSIYNHRLRYVLSELLDIPSKHITGFVLENTTKSIEPYWPSITINGQSIKLNEDGHRKIEEHLINQSMSNNALQDKSQPIKLNIIKKNNTMRTYKYLILFCPMRMVRSRLRRSSRSVLPIVQQKFNKKNETVHRVKKSVSISYINENTSVRIQQWLHSSTLLQSIKNSRGTVTHLQKIERGISNNAMNVTESQINLLQSIEDQLIKQLNGWHCLQILYHHPCSYTLGMTLSQVSHAIINNSQEIFILSTQIQPINQVINRKEIRQN